MRILVRAPNWIGDQIMAYPFFAELRRRSPRAHITVACVPWVADIQYRGLVDEVVVVEDPKRRREVARALRQAGGFDLAYLLPPSFSSAWFAWRAGARRRIGYAGDARSLLLTERWSPEKAESMHRSESYLALLGATPDTREGSLDEGPLPFDPRVQFARASQNPEETGEKATEEEIRRAGAYLVLAPGSNADARRWMEERFFEVAREVAAEQKLSVVLTGGEREREAGQRLEERFAREGIAVMNRIGSGSLKDLVPWLQNAKFFLGNDSGLSHLSALLGVKTYVVWGAGDPKHTAPVGEEGQVKLFFEPIDCWPCGKNYCRFEQKEPARAYQCLRAIDSERVTGEIRADANRN